MAKQTTVNPGSIPLESLNNSPILSEQTGIDGVKGNVTKELVPELDNIDREKIIDEIKSIGDGPFFQVKTGIPKIFRNKLEGKEIPMEYRQKIVDEIGKAGACSFVVLHPEYFEGTKIDNCICDALKKDEGLDDYCFDSMVLDWESLDYLKLGELILEIDPKIDSKGNIKDTIMKYLYNMWTWMCHKGIFREGVRNNELAQKYEYKTIPNKILESNWFFLLPDLLEDQSLGWMGESTDEFYGLLADKLIENYENLDGQNKKKLEECILKKDPYIFLKKVDKLPGFLLDDERILKLLDRGLSGTGSEKSINIAEAPNRYANRLIETGMRPTIFRESQYFQGKIDYFDKIKKIIEYSKKQKGYNIKVLFEKIRVLNGMCRIDKEQLVELAKICEKEGLDIKK